MVISRNNPGNIRKSAGFTWQGEVPGTAPGDFVTFYTIADGYRAMIKQLQSYISRGMNTIASMINTYAPPSDNNPTQNYINYVSSQTGISPYTPIQAADVDTLSDIAYNMSFFEHGVKTDDGTLSAAIAKAKGMLSGAAAAVINKAEENPFATTLFFGGALFVLYRFIKN